MATRKIEFEIGVQTNLKSVEDLNTELGQLRQEFESVAIGSQRFKELGRQIQATEAQLKNIDLQFESLDREQRTTALVDTFNGLVGAVGAVSSAFLAFGVESEAIEEVEKKLLGVIGVVQGVSEASNGFLAAQKAFPQTFEKIGTAITGAFTNAAGGVNKLKVAFVSLGIPALIIGITTLIQNWDKVTAAFENFGKKVPAIGFVIDNIKRGFDALVETFRPVLEFFGILPDAAERATMRTIAATQQLISNLDTEIQYLQAQGATAEEIFAAREKKLQEEFKLLLEQGAKKEELDKKAIELQVLRFQEETRITNERTKQQDEANKKAEAIRQKELAQQEAKEKKANEIAQKAADELAIINASEDEKEELRIRQKYAKDLQLLEEQFSKESEQYKALLAVQDAELTAARNASELKKSEELQALKDEIAEAEANTLEEQRQKELDDTKAYYDELIAAAEEAGLSTEELVTSQEQTLNDIRAGFREEDYQNSVDKALKENELAKEKLRVQQNFVDTLAGIFGQETALGKALLIAKAALQVQELILLAKGQIASATKAATDATVTGAAASADVAGSVAKATNVAPPPFNLPFIASAIATGASVLSAVKSAVGATKQAASVAGGSAGGGGSIPSVPSVVGSAVTQPSAATAPPTTPFGTVAQPPIQTYVLAGDVTDAQDASAQINNLRKV